MKKILIIDDESIITRALKRTIEQFVTHPPVETFIEKDGKRGWEAILEKKPDLILMDLMMPELTGIEILEKMKQKAIFTPVIFMTAYGDKETETKIKNLGIKIYLSKPFQDIQKVASIISESLK